MFTWQAHFLNSGLGFYFIYDFCLYNKMSPLVSYFLRFLPLFLVLIIRPALVAIRLDTLFTSCYINIRPCCIYRMLARKCGKCMKSLNNHGILWITVLLYTPMVHTSMSLLQCFQLSSSQNSVRSNNGSSIIVCALL